MDARWYQHRASRFTSWFCSSGSHTCPSLSFHILSNTCKIHSVKEIDFHGVNRAFLAFWQSWKHPTRPGWWLFDFILKAEYLRDSETPLHFGHCFLLLLLGSWKVAAHDSTWTVLQYKLLFHIIYRVLQIGFWGHGAMHYHHAFIV